MLLIITTNNASHIAINIPTDVADKALPAIASMFENNATFIQNNYSGIEVVTPTIDIHLGNVFKKENYDSDYVIKTNESVLTEGFVALNPETYISNKRVLETKEKENSRLRAKVSVLEEELEKLKNKLDDLVE
jgi:hypothetical protein